MTELNIAKVCHAVNRAYCQSHGDYSVLPWHAAPEWQRESALDGVFFHLKNPNVGPEASHENWMSLKIKQGWKHGAVKDPEKKKHPCLVPFKQLPVQQQAKDYIFRQIVHSLREAL